MSKGLEKLSKKLSKNKTEKPKKPSARMKALKGKRYFKRGGKA